MSKSRNSIDKIKKNIFLDTNIYEENNFFLSTLLRSLFHYSKHGIINLHMTSISKMELLNRMKCNLLEARANQEALIKSINKRNRVLKNLVEMENLLTIAPLKIDESLKELKLKLETNIKSSKINIITSDEVNVDEVFERYYNCLPPFSTKELKKHEFPDAFIVCSIESWCKKNNETMIFVTKDNDFEGYLSPNLIFKKNIDDLLSEISENYDSIRKKPSLPSIKGSLSKNKKHILFLIEEEISKYVKLELDYEKASELELGPIKFKEFKIMSIREEEEYVEIKYFFEVKYKFTIYPTTSDIERRLFEDNVESKLISGEIILPCDIEISLLNFDDIRLKWINSNQITYLNIE